MANLDITQQSVLSEDNILNKNLLAFDDNITYKLPLNEETQKILIKAKLLVGGKGTGVNAEIFNAYDINTADGECGHAEGLYTHADHNYSHVEGYANISTENFQHVQGKYNNPWQKLNHSATDNSPKIHVIGNGTSERNRSNAHFVTQDGSAWYNDKVISDNYFWSRKSDRGGYAGSVFAEDELYVRLDEDGTYDRTYHGTDTVMKGYHRVPVLYYGTSNPNNSKGQIGDLYCKLI